MENQPFNQMNPEPMQEPTQAPAPAPEGGTAHLTSYIIAIIVVIVVALTAWYFLAAPQAAQAPSAVEEQTALPPLSSGDTASDIANDLDKIPDDSAAFMQDQNALDQSIQGL